jgi:hypothetical protein
MRKTSYYSVRTGKNPLAKNFDLSTFRELFKSLFIELEVNGYFQEALGYECVDAGFVPGTLGHDLAAILLLELRKRNMIPIRDRIETYSEDDLFDIIEFLYEHCAKPIRDTGRYHSFGDCGWHFSDSSIFERDLGRLEYRERVNKILALYGDGYELSSEGEILILADAGLDGLFDASLPGVDPDNIDGRVAAALTKFRRARGSIEDRRDAVRDLADVLEYLRPRLKGILTKKDESDLFELANNFGIRHHNDKQKTSYDKNIWYNWMFYH